jgi:hypothetical protein
MRVRPILVAIASVACCATLAHAAADPRYESWAKYKPGTQVVLTGVMEMQGMRNESEQIFTLREVTPDHVVVEAKHAATVMGQRREMPPQRITIPATAKDDATTMLAGTETAREKVTVLGKTYDAKVTTTSGSQNGMSAVTKMWSSPEVPGTILRIETKTTSGPAMTQRMELTKVELK